MTDKRSALKQGQIDILETLYKYRFGSRQLVAESLSIKAGSSLHEKLGVLLKHNYIGMQFDKALKLAGMPAAYYVTPKGVRALQSLQGHEAITDSTIKASYKDKTVGQSFITHALDTYKYTNVLKRHHPSLKVFTRRDMSSYSYFPANLPDAFLSLRTDDTDRPKRYFFDIIDDTNQYFMKQLDNRINHYCQYFESGGWDITGAEPPIILVVVRTSGIERRIQRSVRARLARNDMEDLIVLTTTTSALERSDEIGKIWTSIDDPDDLSSVESIEA